MELTDSVLDTAQDHTKLNTWDFFQLMFIGATSPLVLCMNKPVFYFLFS